MFGPQLFEGLNHVPVHHEEFIAVLGAGTLVLLGFHFGVGTRINDTTTGAEAAAAAHFVPGEVCFLPGVILHPFNDFRLHYHVGLIVLGKGRDTAGHGGITGLRRETIHAVIHCMAVAG